MGAALALKLVLRKPASENESSPLDDTKLSAMSAPDEEMALTRNAAAGLEPACVDAKLRTNCEKRKKPGRIKKCHRGQRRKKKEERREKEKKK